MDKSTDALASNNGAIYGAIEQDAEDAQKPRDAWGNKLEFLLSCVGYAVGLGNIWRFPYLAYRNGGGAFVVPYGIMLAVTALPLFFMELAFGQFASKGPITMWRALPLFKGVGWGMLVVSFLVALYYNVIIAWTLFYFFASLTSQLPWELCTEWWNTPLCAKIRGGSTDENVLLHTFNDQLYTVTGLNNSFLNETWISELGKTMNNTEHVFSTYNVSCIAVQDNNVSCSLSSYPSHYLWHFGLKLISPAEEYWDNRVLRRSSGIEESGEILWELALTLLLAWIFVFLCLCKGVKSLGKVVYFTATFPYVVLTILLIRGCLLDGAINGIKFYIIPDFSKLSDASVWKDAATQIFYSLGIGFGSLPVMSSYNKFNNNCLADALTVALINCGTSIFAGFAIFSMVGFLAHSTGVPVQDAASSGPGLAFIAYPEGITQMPIAPLWAALFFFMLFTLGLDSQFGYIETITCGLTDEFPSLASGKWKFGRLKITKKMLFTGFLCGLLFLLGLPMTTRGGIYVFQLFDWYSASYSLLLIALLEVIGLGYIYGVRNFLDDIELMIGRRHICRWMYFIVSWTVVSPLAIVVIFVFVYVDYTPVSYGEVAYPAWAESLGWLIASLSMITVPILGVVAYCQRSQSYKYLISATKPERTWGPALEEDRFGTKYENYKYDVNHSVSQSDDSSEELDNTKM